MLDHDQLFTYPPAMPAALLAVLLLAATVDPRPVESLQLLAEVRDGLA